MKLSDLVHALRGCATKPVVVPPRILRRVIKQHRKLSGLNIPHGFVYLVPRSALFSIVRESEISAQKSELPELVTLLPNPDPALLKESDATVLGNAWRTCFHAAVHRHFETAVGEKKFSEELAQERIAQVGQTEFDEIRLVLKQDSLLLPPFDDLTTYIEFASVFLEYRAFSPHSVSSTFPALDDPQEVERILSQDINIEAVLAESRPTDAPTIEHIQQAETASIQSKTIRPAALIAQANRTVDVASLTSESTAARTNGNVVRAAILQAQVAASLNETLAADAEKVLQKDVEALLTRLNAALRPRDEHLSKEHDGGPGEHGANDPYRHHQGQHKAHSAKETIELLLAVTRAAATRFDSPWNADARLLYDLQNACIDHERELNTIDVITWVTSLGKRPLRRVLPAQREVRVVTHLRKASTRIKGTRVSVAQQRELENVMHHWQQRAHQSLRSLIKPVVLSALNEVGLRPTSAAESVSRDRMIEELIDHVAERKQFSIQHLRDALSRSELKLPDLSGPKEVVFGDPLLRTDQILSVALDGVYRSGEVYLRILQKVSSLLFGTRVGRFLVLYAILPLLAAYVILEGLQHIVHPIAHKLFHVPHEEIPHLLNQYSLLGLAIYLFALLHSATARSVSLTVASFTGRSIRFVLIDGPSLIWNSAPVRAILESSPVQFLRRYLFKPILLTAPLFLFRQLRDQEPLVHGAVIVGGALLFNMLLNTPTGQVFEETTTDWFLLQLRNLRYRVLPGIFALLLAFFKSMLELVERVIYAVDELLRFRKGESALSIAFKAVAGTLWFFVTYLIRIYVNLLVEPQINPIKHFPVVTVSHKMILPFSPQIEAVFYVPVEPLGPVIGHLVASTTTVLLPGVFGFLAWEFKENWKIYAANRKKKLGELVVGHHGETIARFLRPGFHSGTVPKIYSKLRRARDEATRVKQREELHHVEEAIEHFVDRDFVNVLEQSPRWHGGDVSVGHIHLASNRIRIELRCDSGAPEFISIEEQSGWVIGSVTTRGWVSQLDTTHRQLFEATLAGFFKLSGVDIVRSQVERALGEHVAYDIADEGLVVWPDPDLSTRWVYPLKEKSTLVATVDGKNHKKAPEIASNTILFREQDVPWERWAAFWDSQETPLPPVSDGPPLL